MIEAEELGRDDDEDTHSSTATTLLSEKEYQDFLTEGSAGGEREKPAADKTDSGEDTKEKEAEEKTSGEGKMEDGSDGKGSSESAEKEETSSTEQKGPLNEKDGKDKEAEKKEGEVKVEEPSEEQASTTNDDKPSTEAADEKTSGEQSATKNEKSRESAGGRIPSTRSVLTRRLTSYGGDRALSVTRQRRLSGISSVLPPSSSLGLGHTWDHVMLNCPQFVQLVEMFLGPDAEDAIIDAVSSYIRTNYTETAQVYDVHIVLVYFGVKVVGISRT